MALCKIQKIGGLRLSLLAKGHYFSAYAPKCMSTYASRALISMLKIPSMKSPRRNGPSRSSSSSSSDDSDGDELNIGTSAADQMSAIEVTRKALTLAAVSDSEPEKHHEGFDRSSKSSEVGAHEPTMAKLPQTNPDGVQSISINDPYMLLRAVVVKEPEVPRKGKEEANKVTFSGKGCQNISTTQTFRCDMKRLQTILADMDQRLRSKDFRGYRACRKCPSLTLQEAETRSLQIMLEGNKASEKAKRGSKPKDDTGLTETETKYDDRDSGTANIQPYTEHSDSNSVVFYTRYGKFWTQKKFLKQAKTLFKFFLPLEFSSALVAKYWGAVHALIEVNAFSPVLILTPFFDMP